MKKKLLIVNQEQFGYQIDYFQYCKYLKYEFDITYLCWDYGWERQNEEFIEIIYVSRIGNIFRRNVRFIIAILRKIRKKSFYFTFIQYFRGCSIIPLIYNRKHVIHLDIRTGSVSLSSKINFINNLILRFESSFFKSLSIISGGLQRFLKITPKAYILPLGANALFIDRQLDHKLSLLYVGTISNRRIEDTIVGLSLFLRKHPDADIHYTIIGRGWGNDMEQLMDKISKFGMKKNVDLEGYVQHNALRPYFEKANVGVTYIPITPYFEYQPATKTFEYLMAGMPVIATGTFENKQIVNKQNGVIIADDPLSFANSIELLYDRIGDFDDSLIRESVIEYKWETIVSKLKDFIYSQT
jgi:glycosyltransferase involved in cell wall biosynthesis